MARLRLAPPHRQGNTATALPPGAAAAEQDIGRSGPDAFRCQNGTKRAPIGGTNGAMAGNRFGSQLLQYVCVRV